jgi:hypothetical protein
MERGRREHRDCRAGQPLLDGEVREIGLDLNRTHGSGVPFVVKEDEAPYGLDRAFFGAQTELLQACNRTNLVEQGQMGHGVISGRWKHGVLLVTVELIDASPAVFPTQHQSEAMRASFAYRASGDASESTGLGCSTTMVAVLLCPSGVRAQTA